VAGQAISSQRSSWIVRPFIRGPEEGRALPTPAGGQVRFTVSADESSGSISLFEFEVPAGAGPRLHVHEERDECIYVLHGALRIQAGEDVYEAPQGSCAFIPRGVEHRFSNTTGEVARLLGVYAPGGIEPFFESFAASVEPKEAAEPPSDGG
jgi:quercetin dioxygenase-like cupin family protein